MVSIANSFQLIKYNTRILCRTTVLAGLGYAILLPLLFSFDLLDGREAAKLSEVLISLLGIIFFTSIVEVDFEDGIAELVSAKQQGKGRVFLYRFLLNSLFVALLVAGLHWLMLLRGSTFDFGWLFFGTMITALVLGMVGITAANLTGNLIAGYLVAFSYFFADYVTKGKYTHNFYLFSLTREQFQPKYYLLGVITVLVLFNLFWLRKRNIQ